MLSDVRSMGLFSGIPLFMLHAGYIMPKSFPGEALKFGRFRQRHRQPPFSQETPPADCFNLKHRKCFISVRSTANVWFPPEALPMFGFR